MNFPPLFKRTILLIGLIFSCFILISVDQKLKTVKVAPGIKVKLPKEFYPMTPDDMIQRIPSVRNPLGAYSDMTRLTDFSVKISATQWRPEDIDIAHSFFKAGVANLYDEITFYTDQVVEVHGNQFIRLEFSSKIQGSRQGEQIFQSIGKYSFVQFYISNEETLVFSFNTDERERAQWQSTANEIMNSIRIKR